MRKLPLDSILCDEKFNCRGKIPDSDVKSLAVLIKQAGLINPVTVMPYKKGKYKYKLIAGFRRFRACQLLKHKTIKAEIVDCDEKAAHHINLVENLGRQALHPGQELQAILDIYGPEPDINMVAKDLGVGREWVRRRLKILKLKPKLKNQFFSGAFNAFDLSVLIGCPLDQQESLARQLLAAKQANGSSSKVMRKNGKLSRPRAKLVIREMITKLMDKDLEPPGWKCLAWAAGDLADEDLLGK